MIRKFFDNVIFKFIIDILYIATSLMPAIVVFLMIRFFEDKNVICGLILSIVSLLIVICIDVLFLHLYKKFSLLRIEYINIKTYRELGNSAIPTYIGYFILFFGDSSNLSGNVILYVSIIFLFLIYKTNSFYFNPLLYMVGYNFYEIETVNNKIILLITKNKFLKIEYKIEDLIRLNNYTYLKI